jgi:catechol 2,3-dioxygenase-like lactoylglutathione lyase family enzyme
VRYVAIDHVQLAMPAGGESEARRFYGEVLGLAEIPKPPGLAGRGGAWFRSGPVELHLGVEPEFQPARKAHPALRVEGLTTVIVRCVKAGHPVERDVPLPGRERIHVADPFGNRLELLELQGEPASGAEQVRTAIIEAALAAYEDAGVRGLCGDGAWEAAVAAMRSVELPGEAGDGKP